MTHLFLIVFCLFTTAYSWNTDDLALYDLVEEVNQNFYEFFGVEQDAPVSEIKKNYRRLSLEWHPDRSSADNASDMFRRVVSIYDVLKNAEMRDRYNQVLENGLPDWRSGVYYYRRARKVSLLEAIILIIALFTGVHYLMLWGSYYEQYLVESQRKKTRKDKKAQREKDYEDEEALRIGEILQEYRPTWSKMLPSVMWRASKNLWIWLFYTTVETVRKGNTETTTVTTHDTMVFRKKPPTAPQPVYEFAMATDIKAVSSNDESLTSKFEKEEVHRIAKYTKDTPWSREELATLVKLSTEKFPAGTPNRWDLMAGVLGRPAEDVTAMAGKLKQMKKEEYNKLLTGQTSSAVNDSSKSTKVKLEDWTEDEQKALEGALKTYPNGHEQRWECIAAAVGTKDKAQCVKRFKLLAELVKKKRAEAN